MVDANKRESILAALSERANKRMFGMTLTMALSLLAVCGVCFIKRQ